MSSLSDRIRGTADWTAQVVDVPEWQCKIEVRSLSVGAVDAIIRAHPGKDASTPVAADTDISVDLAIAACYDPDTGERAFSTADREWLLEKNAAVLNRLASVAMEVSGLSEGAGDAVGKD